MLYHPPRFAFPESAAVELVSRLRFGTVVSIDEGEVRFSHLPLLPDVVDGKVVRIRGHFARQNPHRAALEKNPKATIIFNGPNSYISAQWFTPGNPAAPTWNYVVVHAEGNIRLLSQEETSRIVDDLVLVNEAEFETQWDLAGYSPERRKALLPHIVGFSLDVTNFHPLFKLSQQYSDADKRGMAEGLFKRGTDNSRQLGEYILASCTDGEKSGIDISAYLPKLE